MQFIYEWNMTTCIQQTRADLLEYRTDLQAEITALKASLLESAGSIVKSYKKDSGEGMQQVTRKSTSELRKDLKLLRNELRWIEDQLCGRGTPTVRLRRRALEGFNSLNGRY